MDRPPRTYPLGVPCWVDLEVLDAARIAPFYAAVLGWTLTDAMPPEAPGHYLVATVDGLDVAAIASGSASIGQEARWSTYIAVDDAVAAAGAVESAGGHVTSGPTETPGGTVTAAVDPQGAAFRLWTAGRRLGAQHVNAPGGWNFSDLHTDDVDAAFAFYAAFLPWERSDFGPDAGGFVRVPGYGDHLAATADPEIHERQRFAPAGFADAIGSVLPVETGERPHWHAVFTVADRDAAAATARRLGGDVADSRETRWARTAEVVDPAGAAFRISEYAPRS